MGVEKHSFLVSATLNVTGKPLYAESDNELLDRLDYHFFDNDCWNMLTATRLVLRHQFLATLDNVYIILRSNRILTRISSRKADIPYQKKYHPVHWWRNFSCRFDGQYRARGTRSDRTHPTTGIDLRGYIARYSYLLSQLPAVFLPHFKGNRAPRATAMSESTPKTLKGHACTGPNTNLAQTGATTAHFPSGTAPKQFPNPRTNPPQINAVKTTAEIKRTRVSEAITANLRNEITADRIEQPDAFGTIRPYQPRQIVTQHLGGTCGG